MPSSTTVFSSDGNYRATLNASAANYLFYRQIGAFLETRKKEQNSILFISFDDWVGWPMTATVAVVYTSRPDPFNGTTQTRSAFVRSRPHDYVTGHYLWSAGFTLSMDANAGVNGAPDPETTRIGPNAPALSVQRVSATAHVTFPDGHIVTLMAENSF